MKPTSSEMNPYRSPAAVHVPFSAGSEPQMPIRGMVTLTEPLLRKAIGLWIRKSGLVRKQRLQLSAVMLVIAFIGVLVLFALQGHPLSVTLPTIPVGLTVLLLWSILSVPSRLTSAIIKAMVLHKNPSLMCDQLIEITDATFRRRNEHCDVAWRLESMAAVYRFPEMLIVEPVPNSFFPIPYTTDFGVNSFETVAEYLMNRIGKPITNTVA